MKGRKILAAPMISAVWVKIIRIGLSVRCRAISVSLTTPCERSRIVQANAFAITLAASGRNNEARNRLRQIPRDIANPKAAG